MQPFSTYCLRSNVLISTHAPLVRCNKVTFGYLRELYNFYSRTSCEVQQFIFRLLSVLSEFLLTHLLRGATCSKSHFCNFSKFLLTHLLRGATLNALELCCTEVISTHAPLARCNGILFIFLPNSCISTHAPLARCNFLFRFGKGGLNHFYSRTSCEVQHQDIQDKSPFLKFLLTHLLRGATILIIFNYP